MQPFDADQLSIVIMDRETERTIETIRDSTRNSPYGKLIDIQRESLRDDPMPRRISVAHVSLSLPNDTNLVKLVLDAVKSLGDGHETFTIPTVTSVTAESVDHDDNGGIPLQSCDSGARPTILYFHGGQFW